MCNIQTENSLFTVLEVSGSYDCFQETTVLGLSTREHSGSCGWIKNAKIILLNCKQFIFLCAEKDKKDTLHGIFTFPLKGGIVTPIAALQDRRCVLNKPNKSQYSHMLATIILWPELWLKQCLFAFNWVGLQPRIGTNQPGRNTTILGR